MKRLRLGLAASLAAAALLAGCSAMRLAYDHADTWLRWQAGHYLELRGARAQELDRRIDAFLEWHREHALPRYARIAGEAARRLEHGLAPGDVVWGYDTFVAQARESLQVAAREAAPLLDRLTAADLAHLEQRFAEDDRKFERENLRGDERERRKRRAKRTAERLEDWVGKLSTAQLERVALYSERSPLFDELRLRDRRRLRGALLSILRAHQAVARLPELAAHFDRDREPAYAAASEANRREFFALLVDLDRTLTREQRQKAASRLRGFAADFDALAAEPRRRR